MWVPAGASAAEAARLKASNIPTAPEGSAGSLCLNIATIADQTTNLGSGWHYFFQAKMKDTESSWCLKNFNASPQKLVVNLLKQR